MTDNQEKGAAMAIKRQAMVETALRRLSTTDDVPDCVQDVALELRAAADIMTPLMCEALDQLAGADLEAAVKAAIAARGIDDPEVVDRAARGLVGKLDDGAFDGVGDSIALALKHLADGLDSEELRPKKAAPASASPAPAGFDPREEWMRAIYLAGVVFSYETGSTGGWYWCFDVDSHDVTKRYGRFATFEAVVRHAATIVEQGGKKAAARPPAG